MVARFSRFDGRHVQHQAARLHGLGCAQFKQYMLHDGATLQQADGDIGFAHRVLYLFVDCGAMANQGLGFVWTAVSGVDVQAGLTQALRHGRAHAADAEDGDAQGHVFLQAGGFKLKAIVAAFGAAMGRTLSPAVCQDKVCAGTLRLTPFASPQFTLGNPI